MKLDTFVDNEVLDVDFEDGADYSIDSENMGMVFQALIQYSKPIESLVREVSSNCYDSHIEAKLIPFMSDEELKALHYTGNLDLLRTYFQNWEERDVEIDLTEPNYLTNENGKIVFKDFGVGISPTRMDKIMRKFFSSTKRNDNEQIGAFGLGSKSPLGYTNAFSLTTWFFGTRYEYIIHMGVKCPRVEQISKEKDSRINGTEITIGFEDRSDYSEFVRSVRQQLRYFDGFSVTGVKDFSANPVIKGEKFVFKQDEGVKEMHICLGKVYYPIDFNAIGTHDYAMRSIPIGLYFDIGELPVIWNREALEYSSEAVKLIDERIEQAREELQIMWDKQYANISSAEEYVKACIEVKEKSFSIGDDITIPRVEDFITIAAHWPEHPRLPDNPIAQSFTVSKKIADGNTSKQKYIYNIAMDSLLSGDVKMLFTRNNRIIPKLNKFLYLSEDLNLFYLFNRTWSPNPDSSFNDMPRFRKKGEEGKMSWKDDAEKLNYLAGMQKIEDYLISLSMGEYDEYPIPQVWTDLCREQSKALRRAKKGVAGNLTKAERKVRGIELLSLKVCGDVYDSRFFMRSLTIREMEKCKFTWVYGTQEYSAELFALQYISLLTHTLVPRDYLQKHETNELQIRVVKVAMATAKTMKGMINTIEINAFLQSRKGMLRRWLTQGLLNDEWMDFDHLKDCKSEAFTDIKKDISYLEDYLHVYTSLNNNYHQLHYATTTKEVLIKLEKRLMKQEMWDLDIVHRFKRVVAWSRRWDLLEYVDLTTIPTPRLDWILDQIGRDNPELVYRNMKRLGHQFELNTE